MGTITFTTGRFALSPLLPTITDSLNISSFAAGIAMTMMFGFTAIVRYPGGQLSDQLSRKTVLVVGLVITTGGFTILTMVWNYSTFLLAIIGVGVGIGLYSTAVIAWLSDLFTSKQGQALGINNSSIYFAGILGAGLGNVAIASESWRSAFLPIVFVLCILLPALHYWNYEQYQISRPEFDIRDTVFRLLQSAQVRRMLVVGTLFGTAWQGVITFLPMFLQAEKAISATFANNLFALLFLVGAGSNLLTGRISDLYPVPYIVAVVAGITSVGLVMVIFVETIVLIIFSICILGAGLAAIWPALQSYMVDLFPEETKGGDYGAFSAGYVGLASLGPSIVGFISDKFDFTVAFMGLVVCLLVSALLALGVARRNDDLSHRTP
ncbi:MFS transporter [Natronosalvus rutilus]|uniref:MFS transporter n=1 Tax=Natronosalvus rutilus TaxID=2953753 RepID=A0A9E7SX06_9EURY|nr:MFS transporter [Natronosalvus rutilus]UTF55677.1 MFS transporter [Natronosalvus rutilus]